MSSFIALTILTLCCSNIFSHALILPRVPLDKNLKCMNFPFQSYPAGAMLPLPRKPSENYPYYNDNGKRALLGANPKETKILCTPGTETFIKLKRTFHSDNLLADKSDKDIQSRLAMLPANAIKHIWEYHLNETGAGDGVINGNRQSVGWIWERVGYFGFYKLQVANAHRRRFIPFGTAIGGNEVTWGVLKAALLALTEYMVKDTIYGWTECSFEIKQEMRWR